MNGSVPNKKLGDLFTFKNGRAFKKEEWSTTGLPIIRIQNLNNPDAPFNFFEGDYSNDILIESGDLLFSWSGTVGSSFGPHIWNRENGLLNQHIFKIELRDEITKRYAFYSLRHITEEIEEAVSGAVGLVHITKEKLTKFTIPVPALSEQQRTVDILDEAFDGIATAKANAKKNLQNARALFESYLQAVFTQRGEGWSEKRLDDVCDLITCGVAARPQYVDVGVPFLSAKNVKRGNIVWSGYNCISKKTHDELTKHNKPLMGDILYTRVGSYGEAAVIEEEIEFSVFVSLTLIKPKKHLLNNYYLKFYLNSNEVKKLAKRSINSSGVGNLNVGTVREFPIPVPPLTEQEFIVDKLNAFSKETKRLEALYQQKFAALDALKKSLLHKAFAGELTGQSQRSVVIPFPTKIPNVTTTDLHAGILAIAFQLHERNDKQKYYGHVKAEKIAHMVEAYVGIDLGRIPVKDAAGPNDYQHLMGVEHRARKAGFFDFQRVKGAGYRVTKYRGFEALVERTRETLGDRRGDVDSLLELMLPMDTQQADIFCTVYAAWNNLLLDGQQPTNEDIVFEARENWHPDKLDIPRAKFFAAINWMKEKGVAPKGVGKKVSSKTKKKK